MSNNQNPNNDLFGDDFTASMQEMLEHMDGLDLDVDDLKILWPQRLVEFFEVISHTLEFSEKHQKTDNTLVTAAIVTAIANHFGGVSFYLPHNDKLDRAIRDIKIYKAFNGNNHAKLAKQYRCSEMTIRTAIANQTAIRRRKIQPSLFQEDQ